MTEDRQPPWMARFLAPVVGAPVWPRHAPQRMVVPSTESGRWQLWSWDGTSGRRRRITGEPVGVAEGEVTADGSGIAWLSDETGSEAGRYVVAPFEGGDPIPLAPDLPAGWGEGLAAGREVTVAAISDASGFAILAVDPAGAVRTLHRHSESVRLAGTAGIAGGSVEQAALSADERFVCLEHSEHGDLLHVALRVIESATGRVVADLRDEGLTLQAYAWAPAPGDQRVAIAHERHGELRPAIWDVTGGAVVDLELALDGLIEPVDWWPDGSALLLAKLVDGRHQLHRFELETGRVDPLETAEGSIDGARVRPDGRVWYRHQDGASPPRVLEVGRNEPVLVATGGAAPPGQPFRAWTFSNPYGQRVHGFTVSPKGEGPFPLMMFVHGGPTWLDLDRWSPEVQAYVDAGFLVAMVNYRGSIGFGREWRDALIGNIGWPEVEDILSGMDDLVGRGLADPERAVIAGWSWGGYLTLLMHGMHPDRFRAGIAGVPVGDYAAGYEDLSPTLQAYDRALLGGTPADVPQLILERSPISYVDRVKAPILFLAGRNDSRCPLRQVLLYTDRLKARQHPHELYLFDVGHSSFDIDERIRQVALNLDFLARHVPGIERLPGVDERRPELEVASAAA